MQRQERVLLYSDNQKFIDRKDREPKSRKEILLNMKDIEHSMLKPKWVYLFGALGIIAILASLLVPAIWVLFPAESSGIVSNRLEARGTTGALCLIPLLMIVGVAQVRWAYQAFPYMTYPTMLERHYRLLLARGRIKTGVVSSVHKLPNNLTQVEFKLLKRDGTGKWQTASLRASQLENGDRITIFQHDNHFAVL